ncbi:hypothetical protein CHU95_01120 [Niveispirillum lacus]|uniref:Uncharacterized protein n=1 Tax=Niveispirillum lacus TaxID=1981099 RepID=A0A255Z9D5_9PROT|nr:hypothetical protein [Niveispirillum lacus]OYQ37495.1 hypothetical protein CHU95_01120 [Niveispirillum lacus]
MHNENFNPFVTVYSIGHPYPKTLPGTFGAVAEFLSRPLNVLAVALPGVTFAEELMVRGAPVMAGYIKDGPHIHWVFKIGDMLFDSPFDARLINREDLMIHDLTPETRLLVHIHLVDSNSQKLRAMRAVTLSPSLTKRFLCDAMDQLADVREVERYYAKCKAIPLRKLPRLAKVEPCGS